MSGSLPSSLALTSIADGASIVAADHRNNYAAVQAAVNAVIAALGVTAKGDILAATGSGALANVAVGSNGKVPVADSSQPGGIRWDYANGLYRKTTAKQVVNSVAETDLLNGEITVGAGVLGTTGIIRLTAWGDWVNNSGGTINTPRFKLKLGATTLLDTNSLTATLTNSATRYGWRIVAEIANLGATNSQWATLVGRYMGGIAANNLTNFTTGEGAQWASLISGGGGPIDAQGGNGGAVDTTASQALALTVTLASASASHDITLKSALVEVV